MKSFSSTWSLLGFSRGLCSSGLPCRRTYRRSRKIPSQKMVKVLHLLLRIRAIEQPRFNEIAVALLLTESRFRPLSARIVECMVALWCLVILRKEPTLTLGKCQVGFAYWRARFGANNTTLLLRTFDDIASYKICCDYLMNIPSQRPRDILIHYNGRPSTLYVQTFQDNLFLVQKACQALCRRKLRNSNTRGISPLT